MMAERSKSVSELVSALPVYFMIKGKVTFNADRLHSIYDKIRNDFSREKMNDMDGIRIDFTTDGPFKGGWVHVRPSNTEPIFRIIAEGVDETQAKEIYSHFEKYLGES